MLRGKVKAVPSGDTLVIMGTGSTKAEIPPEKAITLSSLMAPKLTRRGGVDEAFAWQSREFLRKFCIGKEVAFQVDYSVPTIGREFGTVVLSDKYVSFPVVASINTVMLKEGLARLGKRRRREAAGKKEIIEELEEYQDEVRRGRLCMWEYGDNMSDEDDNSLAVKKTGNVIQVLHLSFTQFFILNLVWL